MRAALIKGEAVNTVNTVSPKIALHFKVLCESKATLPMYIPKKSNQIPNFTIETGKYFTSTKYFSIVCYLNPKLEFLEHTKTRTWFLPRAL